MSFRFRIDISRCIGCRACEVACVSVNDLVPEHSRNWVPHLVENDTPTARMTFTPYLCSHCEEPPCVPACPTSASYIAGDGRVLVDHDICIGCGLCVPACPYEARYVEPETSKLEKCTLCEGRVRHGEAPACFEVCPADARHWDEDFLHAGEPVSANVGTPASPDEGHEVFHLVTNDVNPKPRLVFSGLPDDIAMMRAQRIPTGRAAIQTDIWQKGAGLFVQGIGAASVFAMAGMVGLRFIKERKKQVSATKGTSNNQAKPTEGAERKKAGDESLTEKEV